MACKSASEKNIVDNINIFDFELSKDEMEKIAKLDAHFIYNSWDPETVA